jgi:hypothetical protein
MVGQRNDMDAFGGFDLGIALKGCDSGLVPLPLWVANVDWFDSRCKTVRPRLRGPATG